MPISDITEVDIKKYFSDFIGRGEIKRKKATKPYTLLKATFSYAVSHNYCQVNLVKLVNMGSYCYNMNNDVSIFSDEEEKRLLSYIKSLPQTVFTLAVRLDFCFNMRIGELRALTWDDYIEEEELLYIHHQMVFGTKDGKRTTLDMPYTKGSKESGIRYLPVSPEAKKILFELKEINGDKKYILQATNGAKYPISTDHFNDHLKLYCEKSGVAYRSSHKIRYLGITKLFEAGVEEVFIQKSSGHANIDMTRKYNKDRRQHIIDKAQWNKLF